MKADNTRAYVKNLPDFFDPEVFHKLENDCYKAGCSGTVIDYSEFPAAEYRYFERLCGVYNKFSHKEISLEDAKAQKLIFYKDYRNDLAQYLKYSEICKNHQEVVKASETLCTALCKMAVKLPNEVSEAFKTALKIVSAARGEDVTEKTVLRNMEGVQK